MRAVWKPIALVAVMAMAVCAYATPYTITSVSVNESYPAVVTWDSTHVYVNWQGLPFNIFDFVDITINGGSGLSGVPEVCSTTTRVWAASTITMEAHSISRFQPWF